MSETYDRGLMRRGAAARALISNGEDPYRMLLQVVWPDHDWAEAALLATLTSCPVCSDGTVACSECGGTGVVTTDRRRLLAIQALADLVYNAA